MQGRLKADQAADGYANTSICAARRLAWVGRANRNCSGAREGYLPLQNTWPQSAEGSESSWAHELEGGKSGVWQGWNVLSALSGNLSGWRIDSTDKSTSRSGQ